MGDGAKPNYPSPPDQYQNPYVNPNIGTLSSIGQGLARGNFMPGRNEALPAGFEDVDLSFLNDLVSLNPKATQTAVDLASRDVIRMRDDAQQDILNQLEANNQLTSSVTGNALTDLNREFSADISDIASEFYLADVERMFSNTMNLFGTGLNTLNTATNLGLAEQEQQNSYLWNKYGADTALEAERYNRQIEREIAISKGMGLISPISGIGYGMVKGNPEAATAGGMGGVNLAAGVLSAIKGGGTGGQGISLGSSGGNQTQDQGLANRQSLMGQRSVGSAYADWKYGRGA